MVPPIVTGEVLMAKVTGPKRGKSVSGEKVGEIRKSTGQ